MTDVTLEQVDMGLNQLRVRGLVQWAKMFGKGCRQSYLLAPTQEEEDCWTGMFHYSQMGIRAVNKSHLGLGTLS